MARWNPVAVVVVAGVAACFSRPGAPERGNGGDGGMGSDPDGGDATGMDALDGGGTGSCLDENFSTATSGCGDWALPVISGMGSTVLVDGNVLVMQAGSGTPSLACISEATWPFAHGVQAVLDPPVGGAASLLVFMQGFSFGAQLDSSGQLSAVFDGNKVDILTASSNVIAVMPGSSEGTYYLRHGSATTQTYNTGVTTMFANESVTIELMDSYGSGGTGTFDNLTTCLP